MKMQSKMNSAVFSRASSIITLSSFPAICSQNNTCSHLCEFTLGKTNNLRLTELNSKIYVKSYHSIDQIGHVLARFRMFLKYENINEVLEEDLIRFSFYLEELSFHLPLIEKLARLENSILSHSRYHALKDQWRNDVFNKTHNNNVDTCRICPNIQESMLTLPKAIGGATYGLYNAYKFGSSITSETLEQRITRWSLSAVNLAINLNIPTLILSLVSILNEFMPISKIVKEVYDLFKKAIAFVSKQIEIFFGKSSSVTQPTTALSVESLLTLSDDELSENPPTNVEESFGFDSLDELEPLLELSRYKANAPVLGAAIASVMVAFGSLIAGVSCSDSKKTSLVERTSLSLFTLAKGKSGIYAVIDMMKDIHSTIYNILTDIVSGTGDNLLVGLINACDVQETDDCKKSDFFEYIKFITDPENLYIISTNTQRKNQLSFCYKIAEEILSPESISKNNIPNNTLKFLLAKRTEMQRIKLHVFRYPDTHFTRFIPFWINLVGGPGTRKSQFVPLLAQSIMEALKKTKFSSQIPSRDQWVFPVNFTEKYMTAYKQQYVVVIDDLFQDKQPLGDRSSALDIITWVSNIPHYTNQASLSEKGLPFDSKIVISSSNDFEMSRTEINDPNAIRRRMNIYAKFIEDPKAPVDSLLNARIKIQLYKYVSKVDPISLIRTYTKEFVTDCNSEELILMCVKSYLNWHEQQIDLMKSRVPTNEMMDQITTKLFNDVNYKKFQVEESGLFSCYLNSLVEKDIFSSERIGRTKFYECNCSYHELENVKYHEWAVMHINQYGTDIPSILTYKNWRTESPELFSNYKSSWKRILQDVAKIFEKPLAKMIVGCVAALLIILKVKAIKGKNQVEEDVGLIEESKVKYQQSKPYRSAPKKLVIGESGLEEFDYFGKDNQVKDMIHNRLLGSINKRGAQCLLYCPETKRLNVALAIHGTCILSNHHFFKYLKNNEEFEVKVPGFTDFKQVCKQRFNPERLYRIGDLDLAVYKCDSSLSRSKSILEYFPDNEVLNQQYEAIITTVFPKSTIWNNVIASPITYKHTYGSNGVFYDIIDTYVTNVQTQKGMSGSLLLANNSKIKNKILGVQVALNQAGYGYFKPVTKSQLKEAIEFLGDDIYLSTNVDAVVAESGTTYDNKRPLNLGLNSTTYIGSVASKNCINLQNKTKIEPSLLHDNTKITREPSVLVDYDKRMNKEVRGKPIIFRSFEGFDGTIGSIDTKILDQATNDLAIYYDVKLSDVNIPRKLLTDYQMINGVPMYLKRIEMKSSPGFPYIKNRKFTNISGKYEWFENDELKEGYDVAYKMKDTLRSGVERRLALAKEGINMPTIAYACLKDETRPIKKIESGTTRTFICLPMDYNLLIRKLFGAFVAAQHAHAVDIPSGVGIDPALQWTKLFQLLRAKSPVWEDFDYKNWDQHLHPELIMKIADVVNHWYGDESTSPIGRARKVLLYDLVHTFVIVKDRLLLKSTGQCSGCAITAELNCLVHDLLMYYVWLIIHQEKNVETNLDIYRENVSLILYGDDIVKSINPTYPIKFFGDQIKTEMSALGMLITPGDKESTTFDLKPPENITFLKRSFRKDGIHVKAPLDKGIIENIIQWINSCDEPIAATRVNCEMALQEAYMHGETYFIELRKEINDRIKKLNLQRGYLAMEPIVMSYEQFDKKYEAEDFTCLGMCNSET